MPSPLNSSRKAPSLMSPAASGRPAGTPSMTATRASPWDSPAVRKRKTPLISPGLGRRRNLRDVGLQDRRRDEHDQLTARGLRGDGLEQPAEHRNVAEQGNLPRLVGVQVGGHAADHEAFPLFDQDLGLGATLVDDRRGARGGAEVHGRVAPRVVLDRYLHLDLGDVAFTDDGWEDVEPQHRFLELDLRTGRADRRIGNFFTERDRGGGVLHRHDLGAGQRPRLAEQAPRLQGEGYVFPAAGGSESDNPRAPPRDRRATPPPAPRQGADG